MNKDISTPNQEKIYTYLFADRVFSFHITGTSPNYFISYWISSKYGPYLQVIASLNVGVHGYDPEMAKRLAVSYIKDFSAFLDSTIDVGVGVSYLPETQHLKEQHALAHIRAWGLGDVDVADSLKDDLIQTLDLLEKTSLQVDLCHQFEVKNYAKLISKVEKTSVRAIHERIQRLNKPKPPIPLETDGGFDAGSRFYSVH